MNQNLDTNRAKLFRRLHQEIRDKRVIDAMEHVPRELFVPLSSRHLAYEDIPLPIEMGQTISQPFIVALMTEALELKGTERVLEVGTGSGYQAAILAELTHWVISVERHPALIRTATEIIHRLGYKNVEILHADKHLGWRAGAPYDGIIVTAGAPRVTRQLLNQLAEGGRLVIPVGSRNEQQLLKVTKKGGRTTTQDLGGCRFVPLIAKEAWEEG